MKIALDVDVKAAAKGVLSNQKQVGVVDHARVVNENINFTEISDNRAEHLLHRVQIGGIRLIGDRASAERFDLHNRLCRLLCVGAIVDGDVTSPARKLQRTGFTNAARGSCYESNFII